MNTFHIKQGDYHRRLSLGLAGISTAGASGIAFRMKLRGAEALTVDNAAGVIDSPNRVSYQFVAPQLDTPGTYDLEAVLTYVDGQETVPTRATVTVEILPALG